jgi:hypothetical protein
LNDAVSTVDVNKRRKLRKDDDDDDDDDEWIRVWKEAAVVCVEILVQTFGRGTEEDHRTP